jgi:hypothetical protein
LARDQFSQTVATVKKFTYFKVLNNVTVWKLRDRVVDARLVI